MRRMLSIILIILSVGAGIIVPAWAANEEIKIISHGFDISDYYAGRYDFQEIGKNYELKWTSTGSINSAKIYLSYYKNDDSQEWTTTLNNTPSIYNLEIPADADIGLAMIMVSDAANEAIFDYKYLFLFKINYPLIANLPDALTQDSTSNFKINGYNFSSGNSQIKFSPAEGIQINSVSVASSTEMTANITVSETAALGSRNVTVVNNNNESNKRAVTITAAPAPKYRIRGKVYYDKNANGLFDDGNIFLSSDNYGFKNSVNADSAKITISYHDSSSVYHSNDYSLKTEAEEANTIFPEAGIYYESDPISTGVKVTISLFLYGPWKPTWINSLSLTNFNKDEFVNFAATDQIPDVSGTLLKAIDDPKVYVIVTSAKGDIKWKKWIRNMEEFKNGGYKEKEILTVTPALLNRFIAYDESYYLKRDLQTGKVYRIFIRQFDQQPGLTKMWIPNPEVFNNQGLDWNKIADAQPDSLNQISRQKLLRVAGIPKIYYITESGFKRLIPDEKAFLSYGNKWDDVIEAAASELNAFPDNNLIKLEENNKVYKLENGQKHWIETAAAFNRLKLDWRKIAPVNQTELDTYPEGTAIQ